MHILLRLLLLLCLSSGLLSLPLGLGLRGSLFFSGLSCSLFFSCLLGGCLFSCFLLLSYLLRFFLLRYIAGFTNIDNRLVPIFHGLDNPVRSSEHHFVRVAFHLIIRGGKTGILELVFHIGQRTPFLGDGDNFRICGFLLAVRTVRRPRASSKHKTQNHHKNHGQRPNRTIDTLHVPETNPVVQHYSLPCSRRSADGRNHVNVNPTILIITAYSMIYSSIVFADISHQRFPHYQLFRVAWMRRL